MEQWSQNAEQSIVEAPSVAEHVDNSGIASKGIKLRSRAIIGYEGNFAPRIIRQSLVIPDFPVEQTLPLPYLQRDAMRKEERKGTVFMSHAISNQKSSKS